MLSGHMDATQVLWNFSCWFNVGWFNVEQYFTIIHLGEMVVKEQVYKVLRTKGSGIFCMRSGSSDGLA